MASQNGQLSGYGKFAISGFSYDLYVVL